MEKQICYLDEEFKVRYFFDTDVRKKYIDTDTGEDCEIVLGNIDGIEIYDSQGNLINSFDYVDFDNDNAIRNLIKNIIRHEA